MGQWVHAKLETVNQRLPINLMFSVLRTHIAIINPSCFNQLFIFKILEKDNIQENNIKKYVYLVWPFDKTTKTKPKQKPLSFLIVFPYWLTKLYWTEIFTDFSLLSNLYYENSENSKRFSTMVDCYRITFLLFIDSLHW